ncbi:hypothetical protein COK52_16740 [Bacillus thuringiensis]|nr:hypothetical protein COK52_16740 [Bacillus thuringiensis]
MSESLYQGFCAEYHLIADLYRIGLEGSKTEGDFGFDILSTNFRKAIYENQQQESYLYQVKARYITSNDWKGSVGNRSVTKDFFINPNDMLKLIMTKNSYLVLYLIEKESGRIVQYLWLSNYQLDNLLLSDKIEVYENDGRKSFKITIVYQENNYSPSINIKDIALDNIHLNISNYLERKKNIIEPKEERAKYSFDWQSILVFKKINSNLSIDKCEKCGEELKERNGKFGKFLGCSAFPNCRYTKSIK